MQIPKRLYPEGDPKFGWLIGEKMAWASDHLARSNTFRNQTAILEQLKKEHRELLLSPPDGLGALEMQAWAKREAEMWKNLKYFEAQMQRERERHNEAIKKFIDSLLRPKPKVLRSLTPLLSMVQRPSTHNGLKTISRC